MTRQRKYISFIAIFFIFLSQLYSLEIYDKEYGYSFDIPENFEIIENSDDYKLIHFSHSKFPVHIVFKLSKENPGKTAYNVLETNMEKLSAERQTDTFEWNGYKVAISSFTMATENTGWAICVPTKKTDNYLTVLSYSQNDKEGKYNQFLISILNGLCNDIDFYTTPGIITTYAYPKGQEKSITLNIGNNKINTKINNIDEEASQFVVDLEYAALTLYANLPTWKEAWERYYRMIYRDSFGRLSNVCSDIHDKLYPIAKKQNPQNPDIAYAQLLLSWVQTFEYRRADDPKKSDFTALPCALCGTGNDCDSRSLLICTLLKSCGIECLLLISPEYSHALAAAQIDAPGQQYELKEKNLNFIMGETTAKVTWGMIPKEMADKSKWIPVILP